ncbi:gamma-glutamyltransferase family protein [Conexibacter sp. SYSU D00693]|uniref:gamma-glutamyltransferase family protein n=1 Tax=Conexibacter sp. SYSU D00693 TaxID=2812560 RepID=UPI00196B103B|nr:gamma-glutamyltransferase [Conexibacter sp. SYSU D00693]
MSAGVVAAGHPTTAAVGADVLRAGGTAVDAAIAACLASWACEPLLTGPGAGGYLMVAGPGIAPALLDFFVAAPSGGERAPLTTVEVSFGSAVQPFHVGASSCGVPGCPAGLEEAARRWGTFPLRDLAAPAVELARAGVVLNAQQAYVFEILAAILVSTPEARAVFAPGGEVLREGERFESPELADTLERFGAEGAAPFLTGDLAAATVEAVQSRGGTLTAADLAGYRAQAREPARVGYRGREVLLNPPPSAGGILLALAFAALDRTDGPPRPADLVAAMEDVQRARTAAFDEGLAEPGFLERFLAANLGSTTHVSVVDGAGRACAVTCTNGEGSGVVVPGTGIHVNNVMGEEDLNPQGFFVAPPGRRMPSMMAPTVLTDPAAPDGGVQLVLGSAGSNRIRSAILQTVVGVVDHGRETSDAVTAPRLHVEDGVVFAEPGLDLAGLGRREVVEFAAPNLFFGGVQAVGRDPRTGRLTGAGDPRRGGAVVVA